MPHLSGLLKNPSEITKMLLSALELWYQLPLPPGKHCLSLSGLSINVTSVSSLATFGPADKSYCSTWHFTKLRAFKVNSSLSSLLSELKKSWGHSRLARIWHIVGTYHTVGTIHWVREWVKGDAKAPWCRNCCPYFLLYLLGNLSLSYCLSYLFLLVKQNNRHPKLKAYLVHRL